MRRPRTRWPRTRWPQCADSECLALLKDRDCDDPKATIRSVLPATTRDGRAARGAVRYCLEDGRSCGEPLDPRRSRGRRIRDARAAPRGTCRASRARAPLRAPPVPWTRSRWCWTAGSRGRPRILLEHSCRPTRRHRWPAARPSRGGRAGRRFVRLPLRGPCPVRLSGAVGPAMELRRASAASADPAVPLFDPDLGLDRRRRCSQPLPSGLPAGDGRWRSALGRSLAIYYDRVRSDRIVDAPLTGARAASCDVDLRWRGVAAERRARTRTDPSRLRRHLARSARSRGSKRGPRRRPALDLAMEADGRLIVFGTARRSRSSSTPRCSRRRPRTARTWFLVSTGYARDGTQLSGAAVASAAR